MFNSFGSIRVEFFGPDGVQRSLPAGCTDLSGEDPYRIFADESALLRLPELVELCDIVAGVRGRTELSRSAIFLKSEI